MAVKKIKLETGGTVWKLLVAQGDAVTEGQTLFIMEVMKMEVPYDAPAAGEVSALHIAEGDVLHEDALALELTLS
ncbi:MAG: acetyl-CoA carboxylase biotin carboxyl carrier protein subunit [Pseudomonadota bacterium]